MADPTGSTRPISRYTGGYPSTERTIAETIHALTEASKELFEAGQRLTDNLAELQQRIANATNWRNQVSDKPWMMAGLAVLGGIVLWRMFSRHPQE
ncbi:MAG TPA: hypothetical protein VFB14_16060 [Bryobacteraceae bacterium]|nr:hypothetical protein [Bryobacteraceae bacterium]